MKLFKLTLSVLLSSLLVFFTTACNANNKYLKTTTSENNTLVLSNHNSMCAVKFKNKLYTLNIPYPCGFVRSSKKMEAQKYKYKGVGTVFVVAGPAANKNSYTEDDSVKPVHMCSNSGQAIILSKGKITRRKEKNIKLGFCHQLGFDEKVFYGYAYPVN